MVEEMKDEIKELQQQVINLRIKVRWDFYYY
jgi:hypothetical protein